MGWAGNHYVGARDSREAEESWNLLEIAHLASKLDRDPLRRACSRHTSDVESAVRFHRRALPQRDACVLGALNLRTSRSRRCAALASNPIAARDPTRRSGCRRLARETRLWTQRILRSNSWPGLSAVSRTPIPDRDPALSDQTLRPRTLDGNFVCPAPSGSSHGTRAQRFARMRSRIVT